MATRQIDCITREYPNSGDITHVGGPGGPHGRWRERTSWVINRIRRDGWRFYVRRNGRDVDVEVVDGPTGPYLRTVPDGSGRNNLLELGSC